LIDPTAHIPRKVTSDSYASDGRSRAGCGVLLAIVFSIVVGLIFTFNSVDRPIFPALFIVLAVTPVILWRSPWLALYITFLSVCLFEMFKTPFKDSFTDSVPFFWNINTIVQMYASDTQFNAIPFNLFEIFAVTAMICSTFRNIFTKQANVYVGPLFWPILAYVLLVIFGWVHGMVTGGDFKLALQEVRAQFYFLIAYLMALNSVRDRKYLRVLLWTMVVCIGIKGLLYTFRRFVTLAGLPVPDQGVGSHEEAFFFDCFVAWLLVILVCGVYKKMQYWMWAFLPLVLLGDFACNRRASTAAFLIVIPILLMAAYRAFPERRKLVAGLCVFLVVGGGAYYRIFRNSNSLIAQPARSIRSQLEPSDLSARDASSNAYRDAEEADLYGTIKEQGIIGYGYGKPMYHLVPIADISQDYKWWDILPHNQILWVWMRVGSIGFFAFWIMICAIIVQCCLTFRARDADGEVRAVSLFTLLVVSMLMLFGLLDLQLSNFRDMLFAGFLIGFMAGLPRLEQVPAPSPPTSRTIDFKDATPKPSLL
jgi:hypothetical protein